ncbi:dynein regulatory complex protein 8-like isoform X2 [Agrilus planipennis]|uniref:Dynein regulatory complex protein 8-like isoform X2 n=1 Tax=Agrilus planipennis TaxID=224129 RepID=A0A7F5R4T0_AGRPL|nr:dynein regulatory complex protein 8-like isoform X2 [Agrilus planipennis]
MAEEEEAEIVVDINNDLERRIADVFELFDHTGTKKVDIRDIATVLRGLGCCPTEAEIQEVMVAIEDPKNPDIVHMQTFLPYAAQLITEHKYEPATPDKLLDAFHVLDPEGHGYLAKDFFMTIMSQDGEPFNEDEIAEMMEIAVDPYTQKVPYEYYINQLMVD